MRYLWWNLRSGLAIFIILSLTLTLGTLLYNHNISKDGVEKRASVLDVESFEGNNLIVKSSKKSFDTYGGTIEDNDDNIYFIKLK